MVLFVLKSKSSTYNNFSHRFHLKNMLVTCREMHDIRTLREKKSQLNIKRENLLNIHSIKFLYYYKETALKYDKCIF